MTDVGKQIGDRIENYSTLNIGKAVGDRRKRLASGHGTNQVVQQHSTVLEEQSTSSTVQLWTERTRYYLPSIIGLQE